MITWKPYLTSPAQYAEVGAFVLEAHPNGSWVVRHVTGAMPCITSELEPIVNPGADIETAKVKAAEALSRMQDHIKATERQQAITMRLCERYREYRQLMRKGMEEPSQENEMEFTAAEETLDADVERYLHSTQTPITK